MPSKLGSWFLLCSLLNFNEIYLLFGRAGFLALALASIRNNKWTNTNGIFPFAFLEITNTTAVSASNFKLFLIFLKIGAILYGSGYVLFAFLDAELVSTGLLSRQQLIDAIAVGQFTPWTGFLFGDFYRLSNQRLVGSHHFDNRYFLAILCVRGLAESLGQENAKLQIVFLLLDAVNVASVAIIISVCFSMGKGTINRLEDNSNSRLQHFTFVWLQKNQQCLCRFGRFRQSDTC